MTIEDRQALPAVGPDVADVPASGALVRGLAQSITCVVLGGLRQMEGNLVPICICAALMMPAYWFVWKYLFPQPYENIWLRLVGSALFLFVAAKDRWPETWRRYLAAAWLGAMLYASFFFTFMVLENGASDVWLASELCALFLAVLVLDWISLIVLFLAGTGLGWIIHVAVSPGLAMTEPRVEFMPIFLFVVISGSVFSYRAAGLREARERARLELGALVAKEIQSPLFSVRTHAVSLARHLPGLVDAYVERNLRTAGSQLPEAQVRALERVPARIEDSVQQISNILEVLLAQAGHLLPTSGNERTISISRCIEEAMSRLAANTDARRTPIIFERDRDFRFHGSPLLVAHALARVLEASCTAIYGDTGGELLVELRRSSEWNCVCLRDSSARFRSRSAFDLRRFGFVPSGTDFSGRPDLAFAAMVMESMRGRVTRSVELGRTSEIVFWFPIARPD